MSGQDVKRRLGGVTTLGRWKQVEKGLSCRVQAIAENQERRSPIGNEAYFRYTLLCVCSMRCLTVGIFAGCRKEGDEPGCVLNATTGSALRYAHFTDPMLVL